VLTRHRGDRGLSVVSTVTATAPDIRRRDAEADGYIDFLCERTALVRLMGREALDGGRRLAPGPRHSVAVAGGLARFMRSLPPTPGPSVDPEQLLITTVALCFFPIEHNDTMLAAMGLDATSERFAATRKRHVVDVLERVLCGGGAGSA
jgi:TetR/AcrR family transcriptional regulator